MHLSCFGYECEYMNSNKPSISLNEWQNAILPSLRSERFIKSRMANVTVLAYLFGDEHYMNTNFHAIECAFLCTWKCWGLLPSVLVVNRTTDVIKRFCLKHGVEVQIEPSLTSGSRVLCIDCIKKLHTRFKTEYVVIIQTDGMPVNPGVERFLGKFDYVGAPWSGHIHRTDFFPYPRYGVGNGGFCLRSRRICEQAAKAYNVFWRHLPYSWLLGDDVFYCKTMPFLSRYWRKNFRYANRKEALQFSVEHIPPDMKMDMMPIGFHSVIGFCNYVKHFGGPMGELINLNSC